MTCTSISVIKRSILPHYRLHRASKTNNSHQWFRGLHLFALHPPPQKKVNSTWVPRHESVISFEAIWWGYKRENMCV